MQQTFVTGRLRLRRVHVHVHRNLARTYRECVRTITNPISVSTIAHFSRGKCKFLNSHRSFPQFFCRMQPAKTAHFWVNAIGNWTKKNGPRDTWSSPPVYNRLRWPRRNNWRFPGRLFHAARKREDTFFLREILTVGTGKFHWLVD